MLITKQYNTAVTSQLVQYGKSLQKKSMENH